MLYFVYIIKCSDNTYYTGVTNDVHRRFQEHQNGTHANSYTFKRKPLTLLFYAQFTLPEKAIEFEKRIKKWSQAKKIALINSQFNALPNLSKKQF